MDTDRLKRRLASIRNVGLLLIFGGALGMYIELGITADYHLAVLLQQDPFGFFAPATLLLLGTGAVVFSFAAGSSQAVAQFVVKATLAVFIMYDIAITCYVIVHLRSAPVLLAFAGSVFAIALLAGWTVGAIALARYCIRIAQTE